MDTPIYTVRTVDDSKPCGDLHGFADLLTWTDAIDLERWDNYRKWNYSRAYDSFARPIFG